MALSGLAPGQAHASRHCVVKGLASNMGKLTPCDPAPSLRASRLSSSDANVAPSLIASLLGLRISGRAGRSGTMCVRARAIPARLLLCLGTSSLLRHPRIARCAKSPPRRCGVWVFVRAYVSYCCYWLIKPTPMAEGNAPSPNSPHDALASACVAFGHLSPCSPRLKPPLNSA